MRTDELVCGLQNEARMLDYAGKLDYSRRLFAENPSMINRLVLYNYETLDELLNAEAPDISDIDDRLVADMESTLAVYLDTHLDGNAEYKKIIRVVSLYLSFITHKPLHPAGAFAPDGKYETVNGAVVCPLRKAELSKPESLCKYCSGAVSN